MLYLKINTPEGQIFEGQIEQIVLPTEAGQIWILPWHIPLVSVVRPWIVKFIPKDQLNKDEFIFEQEWVNMSVWRWLVFTDWRNVILTVSKTVTKPENTIEVLEKMKEELKKQIEKLKAKGQLQELDKALLMMQTIEAEIKLLQKKWLLK